MTMILRRLGNKKKVAKEIQKHFPPHKIYIEPFFGAGGMFFNKPKSKYNIVNDLDSDVFNLFQVVMNQKEELEKAFYMMPIHSDLLEYWKKNEEVDPIKKALRFLFLSNITFMGSGSSIKYGTENPKNATYINFEKTFEILHDVQFMNKDCNDFLNSIQIRNEEQTFIYNDPPYLETGDNYSNSFTKEDLMNLIEVNIETGCKFAISEFDNLVVLELAEQYNLEVITIGERQNLKNKRVEILMVNYQSPGKYGLFAGH